ncbi:MAG: DUF3090 family protein [Candidatus Planktophila sp.]|nr:DUF3090 family protein [Candidatus Planktophila sp.]
MSFVFDSVDRFVAGTVGEPGERAFFIQAQSGARLVTVALEKAQVAALAERLAMVINDLRRSDFSLRILDLPRDDAPLQNPIDSEFGVGGISMAWDESVSKMSLELFEITAADEEANISLKVSLDISQCDAFVKRSKALVSAGRLPCPFCGIPIDPRAHLCPRANGYRR